MTYGSLQEADKRPVAERPTALDVERSKIFVRHVSNFGSSNPVHVAPIDNQATIRSCSQISPQCPN